MNADKIGRIIWHDLFTRDLKRSMDFYKQVAGWKYVTEHATDFAWGGGEKDFVLALLNDEAGAGLTETPPELPDGWIAYVEVPDADATAAFAERLGGKIVREPFKVPGVGRNALLRDPNGALFGVSVSRHSFPAPTKQFGAEVYARGREQFPSDFYSGLFDWKAERGPDAATEALVRGPSGDVVAEVSAGDPATGSAAIWLPSLNIADFDAGLNSAKEAGAALPCNHAERQSASARAVLRDCAGALACLRRASQS